MPVFRINTTRGLLLITGMTAPFMAMADPAIDVPSQALDAAIAELGAETGLQIVARGEDTAGQVSTPVSGEMTPTQALGTLLGGTGLGFQAVGADSVVVTQDARDDDFFDLGTVVVEGERVERDVFNTASSVRAYSGEEIESNFQNSEFERVIGDAANVTTLGISNNTPVIRGQLSGGPVGGALAGVTGQLPRATLTIDGRPLSFNELAYAPTSIWDVETLEVFRGPQTTSQGANSIAGAFNIRTRDPVFEQEFAARAEVASRNGHILSFTANTPLSDSVAVRFAFDRQSQDGYITFPAGNANPDADASEQTTARFKVLWEPVSLPEFSTKLTITYSDFNRPQTQNVIAPFEALISNNPTPFIAAFRGESLTFTHDISYELGAGFSIRNQLTFSDFEAARTTANPAPISPLDPPIATLEGEEIINELILDYAPDGGNVSGLAGLYIRDSNESSPPGELFLIDDEKTGYGIFGEATYRFGNGFDVTAGLRYQENQQKRTVTASAAGIGPLSFDETFHAWLPKFGVGYDFNDDLRMTFQVSRGFNPGGVGTCLNCLFVLPEPLFRFEDETVWNYELGLRGRFFNNSLFVAANLFFSDFDDYQFLVPVPVPPLGDESIISNAESVESYGLEIDADYAVNDRLRMIGSLGLLRTNVKEFSGSAAATTSVVGNDLPFAPDVTASLGLDYDLSNRFTVGGQVRYSDGYFSDIQNTPANKVSSFATLDLRASYQLTEIAQAYFYVNNVFDEITPLSILSGPGGPVAVTTVPREVGFGVRARW
ncbi:MAG: TonB-dependent receptor [Pseudomonadota bacterium]